MCVIYHVVLASFLAQRSTCVYSLYRNLHVYCAVSDTPTAEDSPCFLTLIYCPAHAVLIAGSAQPCTALLLF